MARYNHNVAHLAARYARRWRRVLTAIAISGCSAALLGTHVRSAETDLDSELAAARDRLLITYSTFKGYGLTNPQDVYAKKLTPDRQALFDAVTRAVFVELEDSKGEPTGQRVIKLVEEVRGIWGVRPGEKDGRRMFRLSVRFATGARAALSASSNIPGALSGHVLLPVAKGGDDSATFKDFQIEDRSDVVTFRQTGARPTLQLSMLSNDEHVGEIDLDFDKGCGPWPIKDCHCQPANSDVGSRTTSGTDQHSVMFTARVPFFSTPLSTTWSNSAAHCKATY